MNHRRRSAKSCCRICPSTTSPQIHIKGSSELNLVKKDDSWRVQERGDYPANYNEISDFILKAADLKVLQAEPIGASQLGRMELEEGKSATLLEFKGAGGKSLQTVLLGKKHARKSDRPDPYGMGDSSDGRYVMRKDDTKNVLLISDPMSNVEPNADHWLNKDFFKVEKAKTITFNSTNAASSWKLTRDTESAPWKLADVKTGEVLDTNKVSSLGSTLNFPSFVDVSTNSAADAGLDKPITLVIETFDNFTYTVKLGKKTPENNFYTQSFRHREPAERTHSRQRREGRRQSQARQRICRQTKAVAGKIGQRTEVGQMDLSRVVLDRRSAGAQSRRLDGREKRREEGRRHSKTNNTVTAAPAPTKDAPRSRSSADHRR